MRVTCAFGVDIPGAGHIPVIMSPDSIPVTEA